jgi:hypothetical protein
MELLDRTLTFIDLFKRSSRLLRHSSLVTTPVILALVDLRRARAPSLACSDAHLLLLQKNMARYADYFSRSIEYWNITFLTHEVFVLISFLKQPWYPTDDAGIAPWPTTLAS